MSKINLIVVGLIFVTLSLSCKWFSATKTETSKAPAVDFTTPGKSLDVKVQLDPKQTASGKVTQSGGSVSLTSADGSKFTLDVPANALEHETEITMTAVKTLDGSPLDKNTPTAVQLEPSGLTFKEPVTLTIIPGKEIPVKEQIIFGYDSEGKDYHLAPVDPKSRDIRVMLMHFSGAGVGSGSDAAWAATLMLEAGAAEVRLGQIVGETTQEARRRMLLGDEDSPELKELLEKAESAIEDYENQVILKEIAAAELDCRHAQKALDHLLQSGHKRRLLAFPLPPGFAEKALRLGEIGGKCKGPYQIVGGLDDWKTSTKVCDIMKPFTLTGGGFKNNFSGGMSGTYSYTGPFDAKGSGTYTISLPDGLGKPGTMTGQGPGSVMGKYTGVGTEKYTLTPIEPCS